MRKLTFLTLIFTVMFSSTSYAEWKWVGENMDGDNFYVDFETIRKHDGYVYYWYLRDYLKPDEYGNWSAKLYLQGDCKLFRHKYLSDSYHTQPMGEGTPSTTDNTPDKEWRYSPPDSVGEFVLKSVCEYAN